MFDENTCDDRHHIGIHVLLYLLYSVFVASKTYMIVPGRYDDIICNRIADIRQKRMLAGGRRMEEKPIPCS